MICEITGLNHSTFYANYLDIYDLVDSVKLSMADDFVLIQTANNEKHNYGVS